MAYVPTVPGVPPPMSYGQGYGNWQQYAGFDSKTNPFGGSSGMGVDPSNAPATAAAPPVMPPVDSSMPTIDYSIAPPPTGFGAPPSINQGLALPSLQEPNLLDLVRNYYGVK
jgi:hypothetical protein